MLCIEHCRPRKRAMDGSYLYSESAVSSGLTRHSVVMATCTYVDTSMYAHLLACTWLTGVPVGAICAAIALSARGTPLGATRCCLHGPRRSSRACATRLCLQCCLQCRESAHAADDLLLACTTVPRLRWIDFCGIVVSAGASTGAIHGYDAISGKVRCVAALRP